MCSTPSNKRPEALLHGMGQHVYLNVPAISQLEWHPFSISSAAEDRVTTHHIKSVGGDSFTAKLHALCRASAEEGRVGRLRINVVLEKRMHAHNMKNVYTRTQTT